MKFKTHSDSPSKHTLISAWRLKAIVLLGCCMLLGLIIPMQFASAATPVSKGNTRIARKPVTNLLKFAPKSQGDWPIESVSSMKETKDLVCNQDSLSFIQQWVATAKALGVNYIDVDTPYDNPNCGNAVAYTQEWLNVIRANGLSVWHRHMFLSFEGIYGVQKDPSQDYISMMSTYIQANPSFFQPGDIFTPEPEPDSAGGINGVTYCGNPPTCIFSSAAEFNQWLRDAMTAANQAFQSIGLGSQVNVGYFGFSGFVVWGDDNPDWHGILEDATVQQMGEITIDQYPQNLHELMKEDLDEVQAKYPTTPIIIGEWGTILCAAYIGEDVINTMTAAKRPNLVGFNYWTMGRGGCEALVNDNLSPRPSYYIVQSFYLGMR